MIFVTWIWEICYFSLFLLLGFDGQAADVNPEKNCDIG
jgi:hypothetical protein